MKILKKILWHLENQLTSEKVGNKFFDNGWFQFYSYKVFGIHIYKDKVQINSYNNDGN